MSNDRKNETQLLISINTNLPYELKDIIKAYLPIYAVKNCRKIKKDELPVNYLVCKELNDHFYKKYLGYEVDINYKKHRIDLLKNRYIANKDKYFNPYCFDAWKAMYYNSVTIKNDIWETESRINEYKIFRDYYYENHYKSSCQHLDNFKLFVV